MDECATCFKTAGTDTPLRRCANCQDVKYCSRACQRSDWEEHKLVCGYAGPETNLSDAHTPAPSSDATVTAPTTDSAARNPANTRPKIVLLSLAKQPWFDESYTPLLTLLRSKADIFEIIDRDEAYDLLTLANPTTTTPGIILTTDQALTEPKHTTLQRKAAEYVRLHGGTIIFMALFSSFARPPQHQSPLPDFRLAVEPGDAVYWPTSASRTQSMVFAPQAVDTAQTPAVLGACGRGKVGYTGDVNHEEPTNWVVLAMCGLAG
ncbi:hypothetical protein LTR35_010841 [Friedmanniomyces endolithicus]|nr:hypothetical protein LTS00_016869 [Friedmanniomyces endolithicus]KAK0275571.1 hypothetical protein LTR35_010841 [Friedmanniomyces endolithicus]KAK0974699.1 hypothetical protein LTR54_017009 [Friedmanniomyces endolithicus]